MEQRDEYLVSEDGQTWYKMPLDRFKEAFDDEKVDFWIDLSEPGPNGMKWRCRLRAFRKMVVVYRTEKEAIRDVRLPQTLFGIPVVKGVEK